MRAVVALYGIGLDVVTWCLLLPWHAVRVLVRRASWDEVRARMGWSRPCPGPVRPRILVHAVSAGEVAAAEPVLRHLTDSLPGWHLLLSVGNRTGLSVAAAVAERLPQVRLVGYMPWDRAQAVRRWLQTAAPVVLVVMETELWPNLFRECWRLGIRLAVINGRIYPEDLPRYRIVRGFIGRVLGCADLIGVQDERERGRFLALGAAPERLVVGGNTKFDGAVVPSLRESTSHPRVQGQLLLVAGSTHSPEERWLIDAFACLRREWPQLRLVLAPRVPDRSRRIARNAAARGLRAALESQVNAPSDWDLLLLDRIGRLRAWYAHADVVFVGGSLALHGGHNILEPAAVGRAIVVGPHTQHFQGIVERFKAQGALQQLACPAELEGALRRLLQDAALREAMGRRAIGCLREGQGAARVYAEGILGLVHDDCIGSPVRDRGLAHELQGADL